MQLMNGGQRGEEFRRFTYKPGWGANVSSVAVPASDPKGGENSEFERRPAEEDCVSGSLAALIHDARNMVSVIGLYCDLLEVPGVLSPSFLHYAEELRLVGGASRRLLETLVQIEWSRPALAPSQAQTVPSPARSPQIAEGRYESQFGSGLNSPAAHHRLPDSQLNNPIHASTDGCADYGLRSICPECRPIASLAEELRGNANLLSVLVGPAVTIGLSISGGDRPVAISSDDFTRVLVNLARNASEAMPAAGHLQITLEEGLDSLTLSFTDTGPGIPEALLDAIFSPGVSTHTRLNSQSGQVPEQWRNFQPNFQPGVDPCALPAQHLGLGLSIVRSIVAATGGNVWAANLDGSQGIAVSSAGNPSVHCAVQHGAVITLEFPLPSALPVPLKEAEG